jgi:tetratricopeptide (TPR) repeat protein
VTAAAFWQVRSCGFVHFDDNRYVTENAFVRVGLTGENVKWAFTTIHFGFYYPLTWLSHMADVQAFGLDPGKHHLTSLLLHLINTVLLFLLLARMTGAAWRPALVAALFAIHPLHVESVAWIAERKDVLSTFFWFLCILAYARYAERPMVARYVPVFAAFLLGLISKSMVITLPFTLLLLDYWPLRRWPPGTHTAGNSGEPAGKPAPLRWLLIEKLPLFALVPIFIALTWISQKQGDAVISVARIPLAQRAANSIISYVVYISKMFAPVHLAVFYPHPRGTVSYWLAALSFLAILAATAAALWYGRRMKYLAVGWLWYLGTLIPVIGLVQVGDQAMADRYTYVPLVGLFVAVAWGIAEVARGTPWLRTWISGASATALVVLFAVTRVQVGYWTDTVSLFEHSLSVTPPHPIAHTNLGVALFAKGKREEATHHFREALRLNPNDADARNDLGNVFSQAGLIDEAIEQYREAVRIRPSAFQPLGNLGLELLKVGKYPEAADCFERAVRLNPENAVLQTALGTALLKAGETAKAIEWFQKVLAVKPDSADALNYLGMALASNGRLPEAVDCFRRSIRADPQVAETHENLAVTLDHTGKTQEAIEQFHLALQIQPNSAKVLNNLGLTLGDAGRLAEAADYFKKAVEVQPDFTEAWNNLGLALAKTDRLNEAVRCFQRAVELDPGYAPAQKNLRVALGATRGGASG